MKRLLLVLMIGLSLAACAGVPEQSMVEDQGSEAKIALLGERAKEFWSAFVKEDYEKLYYLYDPFFQARTNRYAFMGKLGRIKYNSFEIKDIKVEGNIGVVTMNVVFSVPKTKFKVQEFSQEPKPAEFEETWLFIGDNWYKEFRDPEEDSPFIRY